MPLPDPPVQGRAAQHVAAREQQQQQQRPAGVVAAAMASGCSSFSHLDCPPGVDCAMMDDDIFEALLNFDEGAVEEGEQPCLYV